ncbi:MAG: DUF1475 family protein [Gammaproteobacteria bacterium]|jgi:uncharacterized membrane protein
MQINKLSNPTITKVVGYVGLLIMTAFVIYASLYGDFFQEVNILTDMAWGKVSLVDLYIGLIIFSIWVYWRESNKQTGLAWSIAILLLGNMITCLYLIRIAYQAEGSLSGALLKDSKQEVQDVK